MSIASTIALDPAQSLRQGDPRAAVVALNAQVRAHPETPELRMFLFQLHAVLGDWSRAESQLQVAAELAAENTLIASTYAAVMLGERQRTAVFANEQPPGGDRSPGWLTTLHCSLSALLSGDPTQAARLRAQAFEDAPASAGEIDGQPFQWISDADSRFGPCIEVISQEGYHWVPFDELTELHFDAPADLSDTVWIPTRLHWRDGRQTKGFVPARYPGSEHQQDGQLMLGRRTQWDDLGEAGCVGLGQRMLVTDASEYPLLDVRHIQFAES